MDFQNLLDWYKGQRPLEQKDTFPIQLLDGISVDHNFFITDSSDKKPLSFLETSYCLFFSALKFLKRKELWELHDEDCSDRCVDETVKRLNKKLDSSNKVIKPKFGYVQEEFDGGYHIGPLVDARNSKEYLLSRLGLTLNTITGIVTFPSGGYAELPGDQTMTLYRLMTSKQDYIAAKPKTIQRLRNTIGKDRIETACKLGYRLVATP